MKLKTVIIDDEQDAVDNFINKPIDIEKLQKMIKDVSKFRKQNPDKIYWKFPKL